jgi:hypothetical protein
MENIKELIQLLERNKARHIDVIGYGRGLIPSMLNDFYTQMLSGNIRSDSDAAQYFFQSDPSEQAYRKLKTRFKNRLLNTLFFLNVKQSNYTEANRAYLICLKQMYAVRILFNRGAVNMAMELAHRVLKQSTLFEFTELSLDACKMLRSLYATRMPDARKFSHYHSLTKTLTRQCDLESQAQGCYLLLAANFAHSKASSATTLEQAKEFIQALQEESRDKPSFHFQRYYLQIVTLVAMCQNDYRKARQVSQEALDWIHTKPFNAPSVKTFFHFQMIACCTYLRDYTEGLKIAEINLLQEKNGSLNWFKNRELSFILAMHTGNYQQAYHIYLQVVHHLEFKRMDMSIVEQWKIFEAYVMYLKTIGKVETTPEEIGNNFRLGKFLNEVPIFSRDKQGMNIPILILQIMFTIAQRRYEMALDRIEAIKKYCTRYLQKDDTYRSNLFIRMLLEIPQVGFHRTAVARQVQPWKEKLEGLPLEMAQKGRHFEVIPYEDLWTMALDSLHSKVYAQNFNQLYKGRVQLPVNDPSPFDNKAIKKMPKSKNNRTRL